MSQETDASAQKAKILLDEVETKLSQRPGWDEPSIVIESGVHGLRKMPEFVQLQKETITAWPQMAGNIQAVAPSERSKAILFVALQSLPPDDYLRFLDKAVGLAETKAIDKRLLKWALLPADKNVRGILEYNYEKPLVRDILQRAEILYVSDPIMVNYCKSVLSGESKKSAEKYFNENPNDPRPAPARHQTTYDDAKSSSAAALRSAAPPVHKSASVPGTKRPFFSFSIVPVVILALGIVGVIVVLLLRKSP